MHSKTFLHNPTGAKEHQSGQKLVLGSEKNSYITMVVALLSSFVEKWRSQHLNLGSYLLFK